VERDRAAGALDVSGRGAGAGIARGASRRVVRSLARPFAGACLLVFALSLVTGLAHAQPFPSRPVTLIVPYAPGGGTDAVARTIARELAAEWNQSVVVENRAGADGWVGTQRLLAQPADGYTMLVQLNSMLLWRWALPEAKLDIAGDLRLITKLQHSPMVAALRGTHAAGSLREWFASCQRGAAPCSIGVSTVAAQLVARQLVAAGGIPTASIVHYKGTAPMVNDALGGHIDVALLSATLAVPLASDGRLKPLAVGTPGRYPRLPATPTFAEAGYAVRGGTTWYGLMVRAGTPDAVVDAISAAVARAGRKPEVLAAIDTQGGVPVFNAAADFERELAEELRDIGPIGEAYLK
jgi:tripartite-type tricarboxylate transporter receptor subunit TctC